MAGWRLQQAHRGNGSIGRNRQPPLAGTRAQPELFELPCAELGSGTRLDRDYDVRRGAVALVVDAGNGRGSGLGPGVDQPQQAPLRGIAAGIEDRDFVPVAGRRRYIVHAREKAIRGADVGKHLNVLLRVEPQPPIADAGAHAA